MTSRLDENGIEPAFGFRVLEIVVGDPRASAAASLASRSGISLPRFAACFRNPRATAFKLARNLRGQSEIRAPVPAEPNTQRPPNRYIEQRPRPRRSGCTSFADALALRSPGPQMSGLVTLRRHAFPLFKRRIPDRFGFLPLLYAFRPADFGSLIARFSYGVKRNGVKPAFLLGKAENVVINPIFQAERQEACSWPLWVSVVFRFREIPETVVENLD